MSDPASLSLPEPPRMTAEQAQDTARAYKGLADHLESVRDMGGFRNAMMHSQWWLAYAIALGQQTPPAPPKAE